MLTRIIRSKTRPGVPLAFCLMLGTALWALPGASPALAKGDKFSTIYNFGPYGPTSDVPSGLLVQDRKGIMYGETWDSIYSITPAGTETVAQDLGSGAFCVNGMTLGTDGLLYGTCAIWQNNQYGSGIIFQFDPKKSRFNILYTFPLGTGAVWPSALTLGPDGNFYGTTRGGGASNFGTLFQITPSGVFTTLHEFQGYLQNDGAYPSAVADDVDDVNTAPLTVGSDGNLYGTTDEGGNTGYNTGMLYQITTSGALTIVYNFALGLSPFAGVTEMNGNFFGQTGLGGTSNYGTIYELTPDGTYTTLHNFSAADDAGTPDFRLTLGPDGNFYDAASSYRSGGYGPESLYEITPSGTYKDVYNGFGYPGTGTCNPTAGCLLTSGLYLNTNGHFYGVNMEEGGQGFGTVYSLKLRRAAALVRPIVPAAKAGQWLGILGQGFSKATTVSFGGKPAAFRVLEDTYLEARVPLDAGKGRIVVRTGDGEQRSNIDFSPLH